MLQLVDPSKPVVWVHPDDRSLPPNEQTLFHIKPLTEAQSRRLKTVHPTKMVDGAIVLDTDAMMYDLFIECVALIVNVKGTDEQPITFEGERGARNFLEQFPPEHMEPIYAAIQRTGALREGEVGNSEGSHDSATS